jgi:hypothetical protein
VLRAPEEFRGGWREPTGGLWVIPDAGEDAPEMLWRGNPARACPPGSMQVVRLFYRHRGGMAPGPLPEAGGVNDQPAWLLTAFGLLAGWDEVWEAAKAPAP